jgi:hypothetical protein
VTNILFTPHVQPTDDLRGVLPTWRLGDDPIFWESLQVQPMPLAGLVYPQPDIPPATGSIVLGEIVAAQVEAKRAPRKRTKGPGLAVAR